MATPADQNSPATAAQEFMELLATLPPAPGLVFHGLPGAFDGEWPSQFEIRGIAAASRNPRVATENFTVSPLLAIVNRTGRDLGLLSAHPNDEEVVLVPGPHLVQVARIQFRGPDLEILVYEELVPETPDREGAELPDGFPLTLEALVEHVRSVVVAAFLAPEVPVSIPGKFISPVPYAL